MGQNFIAHKSEIHPQDAQDFEVLVPQKTNHWRL